MHKQLEDYLARVAAYLEPLPKTQRNNELREMRQHLLNAIIINREFGQSDEDAVQEAIRQFGAPEIIGGDVLLAWRRGVARDRRNFWAVVLYTPIVLSSLLYFFMVSTDILPRVWPASNVFFLHHMALCNAYVHSLVFLAFGLTGVVLGALVPKQAVRGVCIRMASSLCAWLAWIGRVRFPTNTGQFLWVAEEIAWALTGIFAAWMVSRRRRVDKPKQRASAVISG